MLRALGNFLKNRRGNVAIITALSIMPIAIMIGGSIDLSRMRVEQSRLQSAVDAAVLSAAQLPSATSQSGLETAVNNFVTANYVGQGVVFDTDVERLTSGIQATSYVDVPLTFAALLGHDTRRIVARAAAERGGANMEIALVLDITASMNSPSSKIRDLKSAATSLVTNLLANDDEGLEVNIALVPYSNSVTVSSSVATSVRGSITPARAITGSTAWAVANTTKNITGASKTNPVVITSNGHGYANNQHIYITGVPGMTQLNGRVFVVKNKAANTFELYDLNGNKVDGRNYSNFSTNTPRGTATSCAVSECQAQLTSNGHGFQNGDRVYVTGLGGALGTALNNKFWTIANRSANQFILADSLATANFTSSGSGNARAGCYTAGCEFYAFTNKNNAQTVFEIGNCVTERTGAQAYTDAVPGSGAYVGRAYGPIGSSYCPGSAFTPLTDSSATLTNQIRNLTTSGSTSGQIGIAWGWYALSPNFNTTLGNDAVDYDDRQTRKIAVIMTDGAFNTAYCNGVVSGDSSWDPNYRMYVVDASQRINCNATNGDGFSQARQLCRAMKNAGITIYTVAFDVDEDSDEAKFMADCSSGAEYSHVASNGTALQTAFNDIGDSIGRLRLTR